jgi:GAF domain-containing protein
MITPRLAGRPARAPDYRLEAEALRALAISLSEHPAEAQKLVDEVIRTGLGESAAVCILGDAGETLASSVMAGTWAEGLAGTLPCGSGLCGKVLSEDRPLLLGGLHPAFAAVTPPVEEVLLAPLRTGERVIGILWAATHTRSRLFDDEDARLLDSLSRFAGTA